MVYSDGRGIGDRRSWKRAKVRCMSALNTYTCSRNHEGFGRVSCLKTGDGETRKISDAVTLKNISSLLTLSHKWDLGRHTDRHRAVLSEACKLWCKLLGLTPALSLLHELGQPDGGVCTCPKSRIPDNSYQILQPPT